MKHTSFSILIITLNKKFYIIFKRVRVIKNAKDADRKNQRPYSSLYESLLPSFQAFSASLRIFRSNSAAGSGAEK
jgi:hypothetical protein